MSPLTASSLTPHWRLQLGQFRQENEIKGIRAGKKLSVLADYMILYVKQFQGIHFKNIRINKFHKVTGSKIKKQILFFFT